MIRENIPVPFSVYVGLIYALSILAFEAFLRIALYTIPSPILNFLDWIRTHILRLYPKIRLVPRRAGPEETRERGRARSSITSPILLRRSSRALPEQFRMSSVSEIEGGLLKEHPRMTMSATELIQDSGYPVEEHMVKTEDGYILILHRIPRGRHQKTPSGTRSRAFSNSLDADTTDLPHKRPVVFFMHGFMQDSEIWVSHYDPSKSLAFVLADAGCDVWLGNNRCNKYSHKHIYYKPTEDRFWDYSLDELALFDVPSCVDFILDLTKAERLTFIGFSQGSAQGFACFSTNRKIADKVNLFVALGPSTRVNGLEYKLSDSVTRLSPFLFFPLFGRKKFISATAFWQRFLSRKIFVSLIDFLLRQLFGWKTENIREEDKMNFYGHLYSYGSVKIVIHWFQIIRTGCFEMFDDTEDSLGKGHRPQAYPLSQIPTPIALFYGGSDKLPNMEFLFSELRTIVFTRKVDEYEHLDFLWAHNADSVYYEDVIQLIRTAQDKGWRFSE